MRVAISRLFELCVKQGTMWQPSPNTRLQLPMKSSFLWRLPRTEFLLTEDKDFGVLVYAGGQQTAGVVLVRYPAGARKQIGQSVLRILAEIGDRLVGAFVLITPGRARISKSWGAN